MNKLFHERSLQHLIFQRNVLVALSILLAISLVISSSFLFLKNERIVVTPAIIDKEFWVDSQRVSPTYLEQFGCFLGQLLFNKSVQSAQSQRAILLRHTDPSYIGALKQRLIGEEEMLKKQSISYVFYPTEVKVNPNTLEVLLSGDRIVFASGKQISTEKEEYLLCFNYSGTKLFLSNVSLHDSSNQRSL